MEALASTRSVSGPSNRPEIARIELRGTSHARGVAYGRAMGQHLSDFYDWFVRAEPRDVLTAEYRDVLNRMEETAARAFPQLLEWIKGWSDGARLAYERCRILAFHNDVRNVLAPGCSNVVVTAGADGPWMARNCDLYQAERRWQVRVRCYCDDAYSYEATGYVGLPSMLGVNRAGLAVGGASCPAAPPREYKGLPAGTLYLLMNAGGVADCCRAAREIGFLGKGANTPVLDADGDAAVLELGAGQVNTRRPDATGLLVATNHCVSGKIPPPDDVAADYRANSRSRYQRLVDLMGGTASENRTVVLGRRAMGDHEGRWTVCEHVPDGFHTIYSWVIRPARNGGRMDFCWGYPCRDRFTSEELAW